MHWLVVGQHDTRLVDELLEGNVVQTDYVACWHRQTAQEPQPLTLLLDDKVPSAVLGRLLAFGSDCQIEVGCCATQAGDWLEYMPAFDRIYFFGSGSALVMARLMDFRHWTSGQLVQVDWKRVEQHNRDPLACTRLAQHGGQVGRWWTIEYLICVPRVWSCQEHWRFPRAERERIYWLLLGCSCPQSCLRMLDASLLHRIIEHVMFLAR